MVLSSLFSRGRVQIVIKESVGVFVDFGDQDYGQKMPLQISSVAAKSV